MKVTVKILSDNDIQNPAEFMDCQWRLISFNNRHRSYENHEQYTNPDIGLRRKLAVGTAFYLDYFEHSGCIWSLSGSGPQCRWDTSRMAGILIFDKVKDLGAKTYEDRAKDAEIFLKLYTDWCNGHGHDYVIENEEGETLDSCFGFYDSEIEHTVNEIYSQLEHIQKEHGNIEVELEDDQIWAPNISKIKDFGKVLT